MTTQTGRPAFTTRQFWLDTAERTIRTGAQTALALGITDAATSLHLDWQQAGVAVGLAMLGSVLTALAAKPFGGDPGSASFLPPQPRHRLEPVPDVDPAPARRPEHLGQVPPLDRDTRPWS